MCRKGRKRKARRRGAAQSRKREDGVLALATLGQMFSYLTSLILDNPEEGLF